MSVHVHYQILAVWQSPALFPSHCWMMPCSGFHLGVLVLHLMPSVEQSVPMPSSGFAFGYLSLAVTGLAFGIVLSVHVAIAIMCAAVH